MSATADAAPYLALLKPAKLVRLFGAVALAAAVAIPFSWPDAKIAMLAVLGGCIVAAGANALNMFIDRDLDAGDSRTVDRPLPAGEVRPQAALAIALGLILIGAGILWGETGMRPTVFVLAVVALYATLYEWLKRNSPFYTIVGGAIWAAPIPALWLALGRPLGEAPIEAFAVAAIWTTLHVWSTALVPDRSTGSAAPRFLPSMSGPQVTRFYVLALTCVLVSITVASGSRPMLPFDALLAATAIASLCVRKAYADRWVTGAAIIFIAAFIVVTAVYKV
jgi:protoheme IX farnesyltransferase